MPQIKKTLVFPIMLLVLVCGNALGDNPPPAAVIAAAVPPATEAQAAPPQLLARPNTQGFYPLWENTGLIQPARQLFVATTGVQFGFENNGHVGLMPLSYIYRTPNLYFKYRLMTDPDRRWQLAIQGNLYYILQGGARSMFSPVYTSRLDNSDFSFALVPVALSGTYLVKDWWVLHATLTELGIFGGGLQNGVETGLSAVSEFRVTDGSSLLFHLGEVGFWSHDFWYTGASYRYHSEGGFELRLGYFYRMFTMGAQSGALVGAGFEL